MGAKNTKLEDLNLDLDAIHRYEIDLSRGMLEADGDEGYRRLMKAVAPIGPTGSRRALRRDPPPRLRFLPRLSWESKCSPRSRKSGCRST